VDIAHPVVKEKSDFCRSAFFLLLIFFQSCSCKNEKIEAFLYDFMIEEGGCYTLLGDKPMTSMLIMKASPEKFAIEALSPKSRENVIFIENRVYKNFSVWKKWIDNFKTNNFCFVEVDLPFDSSCSELFFINLRAAERIIGEHMDAFHQRMGSDWTSSFLVKRLKEGDRQLWQQLLVDHYLSGLLYGYGQENVLYFCETEGNRIFSHEIDELKEEDFIPIPTYAVCKRQDPTTEKYRSEKTRIQNILRGKKLLDSIPPYLSESQRYLSE